MLEQPMIIYSVAILCVVGVSIGQILFKITATLANDGGTFVSFKPIAMLFTAMVVYGVCSMAWVWVLQKVELGRVYPLTALAFVLVPINCYFLLGERFTNQYFIGVVIIAIGIFVVVKS